MEWRPRLVIIQPGAVGLLQCAQKLGNVGNPGIFIAKPGENPENQAGHPGVPQLLAGGVANLPVLKDAAAKQLITGQRSLSVLRHSAFLELQHDISGGNPFSDIQPARPQSVIILLFQQRPAPASSLHPVSLSFHLRFSGFRQISENLPADGGIPRHEPLNHFLAVHRQPPWFR
ncbi:hypothetical protein DSECCO2_279230 [anaerobic digester metagenome]